MKRSIFLAMLIIPFILTCTGCEGDPGPVGPNLKGDIYGICQARDLTNNLLTNHSGIVAQIVEKNITATTDSTGRFVLRGVTTGTYTLTFLKSGYSTGTVVGLRFIGGGDIWWGTTIIYELPHFTITTLTATTSSDTLRLTAALGGSFPTGTRYVRYFISMAPDVSFEPSKYLYTNWISASNVSTTATGFATRTALNASGITSGQPIYIIGYPEAYGVTSYVDPATGRSRFTNFAPFPSNVASVVAP